MLSIMSMTTTLTIVNMPMMSTNMLITSMAMFQASETLAAVTCPIRLPSRRPPPHITALQKLRTHTRMMNIRKRMGTKTLSRPIRHRERRWRR